MFLNIILMFLLSSLLFFFLSMIMFIYSIYYLLMNINMFYELNILKINTMQMNYLIYMDWMMFMFIFTVLIISSMILLYSYEYMNLDKNYKQFFWLMILFILSMIFLIISPNLISMILGWDGLGLISYCLVIYYNNKYSYSSGNLTILTNRIGDVTLIISIIMMFNFNNWNYMLINTMMYMMIIMIIITSFTKSAQFPFSAWLPVAMAAPTPVSSLVHSSTLVTAGIFLMIRFKNLIYFNNYYLMMILLISMITMLMSSICAMFEYDLKKIIAYSTLSQLGLMFLIFSMKMSNLSFFHLIIHAMFKSMMFMCSGIFIHSLINNQDIRFFGNLINMMPMSCMMFFISNLSLCGMPFFSGFFSKDLILEYFIIIKFNYLMYMILIISIMSTLIYSFRLIFYLMNNKFNFLTYYHITDSKIMNFSMMVLLIMAIVMGMIMNWLIYFSIESMFLFKYNKLMILLILFSGVMIGYYMFILKFKYKNYFIKYFFNKMWFSYSIIYKFLMIMKFGKVNYMNFDKGWSEFLFKNSMNKILNNYMIKFMNNYFISMILFMNYYLILMILFY